ncbi:MAG: hypothetical protein HQ556_11840 [Candidatus Marinimicrobia bacterium]|nr:hypothetical protein [Candidatus Neomarinimicrobiota bacterium]
MSFWKAFFVPFRLFLGAVIFFLIFNPGTLLAVLAYLWHLITTSWIASAVVSIIVLGFVLNND